MAAKTYSMKDVDALIVSSLFGKKGQGTLSEQEAIELVAREAEVKGAKCSATIIKRRGGMLK